MSQNTQQYSKMGTDLQTLPDACNVDLPGQVDTLKIVPCPICRATYLPSDEQMARSSTDLLETAFIGICRFCFRCQRPACPQCWNPVHHACASCSEEAHLPFRAPVPSLEGLIFLPSTATHTGQANAISFTCKRNGRFYTSEATLASADPRAMPGIQSVPTTNRTVASDTLPTARANNARSEQESREINHYPTWLQEVLGQKVDEPFTPPADGEEQAQNSPTPYTQAEPTQVLSYVHENNWSHMAPMVQPQTVSSAPSAFTGQLILPALPEGMAQYQSEPAFEEDPGDTSSLFERVENVLIVITSILLLAVVLMIVLSIISAQINTFFLHLLHIDIRTEIAYLLQLR